MKKFTRLAVLTAFTFLLCFQMNGWGQPWTYDFGTGTGTFSSTTASTSFLPTPPSGTARVRVGTNPGSMVMANAGLAVLGTNTELQITSNTGSSSTTKFSVYDFTAGKVGYVKFKIVLAGGTNGVYNFWIGDGATYSDNNAVNTAQSFVGLRWTLGASNAITYNVLNNTTFGTTGITNPTTLFTQSTSTAYLVEVYANNTTAIANYSRSSSAYTLNADSWDLWVDGTRVGTSLASGALANDVNFDSYAFNHQVSVTAPGTIYLDDIEYSNALPIGASVPTVTTQSMSAISTVSATGNGNITVTGSANATDRGFCYDIYANPDPDIADTHTTESGSFGTGAFTGSISSLSAETRYKTVAYATNTTGTGYGTAVNFWTLSLEPSAHSTTFGNTVVSQTQIDLSFDAASTVSNADGYLILIKAGSAPTGLPTDGSAYSVSGTIGDGTVAAIVSSTSTTSASISGLTAGTAYYFTLIPFNYNGSNNETYNYKTDGSIPGTNGTTSLPNDVDSYVGSPASQADPVLVSSINDTDAEAVEVFKFKINDVGTDGLETKVTQVKVVPGSSNVANWANVIQGVKLSTDGGSTFVTTGTPTITATSILFPITTGNLNVTNGSSVTVSLFIYLKTSGLIDNQLLEFQVTAASHGFVADGTGSTFLTAFSGATVSNQMLVDITASKLKFIQQPTSTLNNTLMTPAVTIEAVDENNNRDLDKSGSVSLSSSGTMSGTVTATLASGFGTFGDITHTATGSSLTLTASLSGLTNATSNTFSIFSALATGDILFLGYGTDDPDKFAFLVMNTIPDGTQISFTDNAWTGTALATTENTGTYTVPSGGLTRGSVIQIQGTTVTGGGTMSFGLTGLSASGDQILAYQGSSTSPSFLAGISSTGWISTGSPTSNQSYLPNALASNVSAVGFSSEEDNGYYSGPMTLANNAIAAFICNPANWTRSSTVQTFPAWSFTLGNHTLVDVTSAVQNLNILNIESLTIDASKQLTVAGNLVLESDATGTGSLIDNGTLVSTNNTVERFITKYIAEGDDMYHFLSSPVALQNISTEFSNPPANSTDDFFKFDEATYMWINFRDNTGNEINGSFGDSYKFVVGKGYLVAYNADVTKSFTGTLNTSTISVPAMTYTSTLSNPGWNLIGNPYPSAIDWDLVATGQYANMDNAVYVYDNASATYKSYVGGAGSLTDGIIPAMQGFFVHANAGSPTLSLENADRVHGGATYYKNGTLENVVRLKVEGNNRYDETFIRFNDEASTGFDASFDAFKLYGGSSVPTFYTLADDRKLSVNSLPTSSLEGFVPLAVEAGAENTYSISLTENSLPASTYVTLEDTKTGSLQRLNDQPTYSFTAAPGEDPNRFRLHFKDATSVSDPSSKVDFTAYAINGQLNVLSSVSGKLSITDMSGKTISIRNITKGELNTVSLNGATGLYLVKMSTSQGNFIQKVVVK